MHKDHASPARAGPEKQAPGGPNAGGKAARAARDFEAQGAGGIVRVGKSVGERSN